MPASKYMQYVYRTCKQNVRLFNMGKPHMAQDLWSYTICPHSPTSRTMSQTQFREEEEEEEKGKNSCFSVENNLNLKMFSHIENVCRYFAPAKPFTGGVLSRLNISVLVPPLIHSSSKDTKHRSTTHRTEKNMYNG